MTINRDLADLVPTLKESGGNIGVGVSPSTKLTVSGANTASRGQLSVVGASDSARITLYQDSTYNGIFQSSNTETDIGTTSATPIKFLTNSTERLRIPSDAGGIQFPATQVASSNANTLDDYEEGTWTPVLAGREGSVSGQAYSSQIGKYTKIGNVVYWSCDVQLSTEGTPGTGSTGIRGLPFSSVASVGSGGFVTTWTNTGQNYVFISCANILTETNVIFKVATAASSSNAVVDPPTDFFTNTTRIVAAGFYYV